LSLPKVWVSELKSIEHLRKVSWKSTLPKFILVKVNLPKGLGLNYEVLESTFGRDRKTRMAIG
jgi:hypothetical protein